jgi:hypothetical protein
MSCETPKIIVGVNKEIIRTESPLNKQDHLGYIDPLTHIYYHLKRGECSEGEFEKSGYVKDGKIICVDNNTGYEREIGSVVNGKAIEALSTYAQKYSETLELILNIKDNNKNTLYPIWQDMIKTCKALGDFEYLNNILNLK